jgi:hypothetical protein
MIARKFVFLSGKLSDSDFFSSGQKKGYVKANGLVDTANRTSVSDQQLTWAQLYEKRMRRFNGSM